jgi:hypothetical protein
MKRADVLTAGGLVLLLVTVALTAPRWSRWLRQPVRGGTGEDVPAGPEPTAVPAEVVRTINVKLFFEDGHGRGLVLEERSVPYHASLSRQIQVVVEELLRGSRTGSLSPLAGNAKVLEVFVTARGAAYVDLSKEITAAQVPGARAELLAVYSLVNSVALNFPAIRRVQIMIDGQPAQTLAGHVDLSRPLLPDMTLLASSTEPQDVPQPTS